MNIFEWMKGKRVCGNCKYFDEGEIYGALLNFCRSQKGAHMAAKDDKLFQKAAGA